MYVKYKACKEPAPGLGEALFKGTNLREPFPCAKGEGFLRFAVMPQAEKKNKDFPQKSIDRLQVCWYNQLRCRGIAQFGSALGSGPRGRRFKSCCSDHLCGCSSMVERQPSKLVTRVRFPSPAPFFYPLLADFLFAHQGEGRK